jgi:hypothetical protein
MAYLGAYKDITGKLKPLSAVDVYNDQQARKEAKQRVTFNRELGVYDTEQNKHRSELERLFGTSADVQSGLAQRGLMSQTQQFLQRRGIAPNSELAASIAASSESKLSGQVLGAKTDFSSKLSLLIAQNRDAFINHEFDFLHRLSIMDKQFDMDKEIMRLQQQFQADRDRWGMFNTFTSSLGTIVGALVAGPVGAAAGAAIGGSRQSDEYGVA